MATKVPAAVGRLGQEELARDLLQWAVNEMNYDASPLLARANFQLPSEADMKVLCQGPMVGVWKHIIKHVKSRQTVEHIQKNLAVNAAKWEQQQKSDKQKKQGDMDAFITASQQHKVSQERERLLAEISSCKRDVDMLERELDHGTAELAQLELRYQSVCQRVRDQQKERSVMSVVKGSFGEQVQKYSEYVARIDQRRREVSFRGTDFTEDERHFPKDEKEKTSRVESESCRDVRVTCEMIGKMLGDILTGAIGPDKQELEKVQQDVWRKVRKTSSARQIHSTVSALVESTQVAAAELREETVGLDLAKDAHELSFTYKSSGKLEDVSTPPALGKSLQKLLLAANQEHVLRFLKEQEHKNESWKLEARLDDLMEQIHKLLEQTFAKQPGCLPLAKNYVDALIAAAVERSVVPCLRSVMDDLTNQIYNAKQEKKELHAKHATIENFKSVVEKKQNVITMLARHNTNSPNRLKGLRQKVLTYVDSHQIPSHEAAVRQTSNDLSNSLASELAKFSSIPLPCLLSVQMDRATRVGLVDLSMAYSFHPLLREKLNNLTKVLNSLDFSHSKSLDQLFPYILNLRQDMQDVATAEKRRKLHLQGALENAGARSDNIQAILEWFQKRTEELTEQARQHKESQCAALMPSLSKFEAVVTSTEARIDALTESINIWTEQPAQWTTPWVTTDGKSFEQWMQKWRMALTLAHKSMGQQH